MKCFCFFLNSLHVFLINIIDTEYIEISGTTGIHRKHRNHKSKQKHAFRWSLWHCSSQHRRTRFFAPLTAPCHMFLSAGARGGFTQRIVTHLRFFFVFFLTYRVLTAQSVSENDRWQWESSAAALPGVPTGLLSLVLLMAGWRSSCREHGGKTAAWWALRSSPQFQRCHAW